MDEACETAVGETSGAFLSAGCPMPDVSDLGGHVLSHARLLTAAQVVEIALDGGEWQVDPMSASRRGDGACVLVFQRCGRGVMPGVTTGGGSLEAGDLLLVDAGDAQWCLSERSQQIRIRLPRRLLAVRLGAVPTGCGLPIPGDGTMAVILRSLVIATVASPGRLSRCEERGVRDAIVDLLAAALGADRERRAGSTAVARATPRHWPRIRADIENQLADPSLSPDRVAAANRISTRHLHRLFAQAGTSFGEHVRCRRLQRCRDDLADPGFAALSVTQIAFRWGFSDCSHFSRSFKSAFGMTARDFRAVAADGDAAPVPEPAGGFRSGASAAAISRATGPADPASR